MAKKITMEERINTARESLKNGASLEVLQSELRNDLEQLKVVNGYSQSQIETYETIISNLDKEESVKLTSLNKDFFKKHRLKLGAAGMTLVLVVGTSLLSCSNAKNNEEPETEMVSTDTEEEPTEIGYVLPDYLNFDVNDNKIMIQNVIDFMNDGLSKGLTTVEEDGKLVSDINEDNKTKKIESYVAMFIMANLDNMDYKTLANLNQQGNLTADDIYQDAITAMREIYYDAFTLKEGQELDVYKIFADKNCADYIKRLEDLIVRYNMGDDSERKEIIKEAIAIKEEFLTYSASKKTEMNPFAIDYAFTRLDVLNMLSNGKIITDNEADIGLYNAVLKSCVTEDQIKEWGLEEITLTSYKGDNKYALVNVVRNMERDRIIAKMQMALDYANVNEIKNVETSFNYIVSEISKGVDLNNFKANEYSYSDWLYMVRNSTNKTVEEDLKNSKPVTETVTKTNIPAKDVPAKDKIKDEVISTTVKDEKGNDVETNQNYLKAKAAAWEDASRDVAEEWIKRGTSLTIGFKKELAKPNEKTASYKEAYNYWYAKFWNETLTSFQKDERKTNKENKNTESEFIPNGEPVITDKSDNFDAEKPDDEVYFEEVEEGTVIEEGIIDLDGQYYPSQSNTSSYPQNTTSSTPSYDSTPSTPSYDPTPSTPSYDPTPSTPSYDSTPSTPSYDSTPSTPSQDSTPSTPSYEEQTPGTSVEQGTEIDEGLLLFGSRNYSDQISELEQFKQELLESVETRLDSHIR